MTTARSLATALFVFLFLTHCSGFMKAGNNNPKHKIYIFNPDTAAKKDSADTLKTVKHRTLTPGISWASNNTYQGRKDSMDHALISPSIAYEGKYGFNASITASHTALPPAKSNYDRPIKNKKKTPVLDEYDFAAGYNHNWNDDFSSSILETHNHFDAASSRLKTTIDNDVTLGSTYDGKYITAEVNGDWAHGRKTQYGQSKDYFYTLILSHQFSIEKLFHSKWELDIVPKGDAVYGTQNYYLIYTKGLPLDSKKIKQKDYEAQLAKYNLLNYELKLPISITNDKWTFGPEWDYEVPLNTPAGAPSLPFSVYSVNLTYTFTSKK